jgi:hypothetical protein
MTCSRLCSPEGGGSTDSNGAVHLAEQRQPLEPAAGLLPLCSWALLGGGGGVSGPPRCIN